MMTTLTKGKPWFIPIYIAAGLAFLFVAYLYVRSGKKPVAPAIPVVSSCKKLGPGMRRLGPETRMVGHLVFEFDVPLEGFVIEGDTSDAPAGGYGFNLVPKNSRALLDITWDDPEDMEFMKPPIPPELISPRSAVIRKILDDEGTAVGGDSWGYWGDGELWRRVRLRGHVTARYGSIKPGDVASYGSVHQKEADLFDQIINSVCMASEEP
jgi:hypothetical protein